MVCFLPPKKANEVDIMTAFEICFRSLKDMSINENVYTKERFKHKFAESAYSYAHQYNDKLEQNLTTEEWKGLLELKKDQSIVVLKADKGNCVVLLKKEDYVKDLENLLSDTKKFKKLDSDPTVKREERLIRYLLQLKQKKAIDQQFHDKVRPSGSQPARLYGLPKVHKPNHPLRPICSSIGSYNYRLASELASILSPFASNDYTIKNTFDFVKELQTLSAENAYLCSFDVTSLFTNIPLNQTIEIALDYLFQDNENVEGLSRSQFKKLLQIATSETNFIFNGKIYDQVDGVAMGSPLAPILSNIFMRWFEEKALESYNGEKPSYYRRYVDDTFVIFSNQSHVSPFFQFINKLHPNISFTKEEESDLSGSFPFLDINIGKENQKFTTNTFYKSTHTGVYTNWFSYTPRKYKINLIKTLVYRAWNICSDTARFNNDVDIIKTNLLKNQFPKTLLNTIVKNFVEKMNTVEPEQEKPPSVEKKEVMLVLPYYGTLSESFDKSLKSLVEKAYNQVKLRVVFRTTYRLANLFNVKDVIPKSLVANVVYGVYCTDCPEYYVGKTKRHLKKRFDEHRDIRKPTAVSNHIMENNHDVLFPDVKVIARGNNDLELLIKESLIIKQLRPPLNANVASYPLEMF